MKIARVAGIAVVMFCGAAMGQVPLDEFGFLEEWEVLSEAVRLGEVELNGQGLAPGYDTEVSKLSEEGLFQVSIAPQQTPAPFNEIHTWLIRIEEPDGAPVSGAELKFYGGMPLHNHAFPTEPAITGEIEPGVYAVEGIKFSMMGWWSMAMGIVAGDRTDKIGFNLKIEP